jgi:menaquinol-cytochrome c reductase iron-sulfur subunit
MNEKKTEHISTGAPASPTELSRRKFLERLSLTVGGVGALILVAPMAGFILAPFFVRARQVWRSVGKVDSFKIGETKAVNYEDASPLPWAGVTARSAAWLRRVDADTFIAFSINCTHLGCPVRWLASANLFMCPCHGGVYYQDGAVAAGPPPAPLPRYRVRVKDGDVQIQTAPIPISTIGKKK